MAKNSIQGGPVKQLRQRFVAMSMMTTRVKFHGDMLMVAELN